MFGPRHGGPQRQFFWLRFMVEFQFKKGDVDEHSEVAKTSLENWLPKNTPFATILFRLDRAWRVGGKHVAREWRRVHIFALLSHPSGITVSSLRRR